MSFNQLKRSKKIGTSDLWMMDNHDPNSQASAAAGLHRKEDADSADAGN